MDEVTEFLTQWSVDPIKAKEAFVSYQKLLTAPEVTFTFNKRPGVSYSLRATHAAQTKRQLFCLIDVIDDEPDNRWLSVCFYADMVTDPKDVADFVPAGLLGEDARCFNLDEDDADMRAYIADRLKEAFEHAAGSSSH